MDLEKLRGDLAGSGCPCINGQWRIIFRWEGSDALDAGVMDYHREGAARAGWVEQSASTTDHGIFHGIDT